MITETKIQEVVKEVPVEKVVTREVIKEVAVEKVVTQIVEVEKEKIVEVEVEKEKNRREACDGGSRETQAGDAGRVYPCARRGRD